MTNEEAIEAAGDLSPPAATLEQVALELGTLIDAKANEPRHGKPAMLLLAPTSAEIIERSTVHLQCWRREDFAIASHLLEVPQRDDKRWPYRHFMIGSASPVNVQNAPAISLLVDAEAVNYYRLRARATPHAYLAFRYSDLAGLTGNGKQKVADWTAAIHHGIKAFTEWVGTDGEQHNASTILLRALEIAAILRNEGLVQQVGDVLRTYVQAHLLTVHRTPIVLVHGFAALRPRAAGLDYVDLTERLEKAAEAQLAGREEASDVLSRTASPFALAYDICTYTREPLRIQRVTRRHAERLVAHAEALANAQGDRGRVHDAYNQAWRVLLRSTDCEDLKVKVRRGLQDAGARLREDLQERVHEIPLNPEAIAQFEALTEELIKTRSEWPVKAAILLLPRAPTEAEANEMLRRDTAEFPLSHLFAQVRIEDNRPTTTGAPDWKAKVEMYMRLSVVAMMWPKVLAPAIRRLFEEDQISVDVLVGPFVERGFPPDLLRSACSAAFCLSNGDHAGATQLWCLFLERTLRFVIGVSGGSTTAVDREGSGEREAVFDSAVEEFCRLIEPSNVEVASRTRNLLCTFMSWRGVGYNWRNRVAHGTMPTAEMGPFSSYISYLLCVLVSTFLVTGTAADDQNDRGNEAATSPDSGASTDGAAPLASSEG